MPQQNYLDELTPGFTPLLAIKEASRCLLCHDAPCSQACPAQTDPGKFIRSIYFRNFKGAAELSGKIMRLAPSAPESVRRKNYASADVHVPE